MRFFIFFFLLITGVSANAQIIKSPDDFLGYKLGTRYTNHYKIINYFESLAAAASGKMQLKNYGYTNEGRPLVLAVMSSPENMKNIEAIRLNSLRMAGMLNDKAADSTLPAIVWLSYNVHGNETSSSEAAMMVAYDLVSGKNNQIQSWLNNTVVIIDPCLNPDGRDRYVNWFNQMTGKNVNPNPAAREHDEPWPGGRSNHYNFDLNRDWAWQTQVESEKRISIYNDWMPQIHCDFHEQSVDAPYYFAPAVEPYHEVITPWQRSFQTVIGKNHAKYFDKNGWLYFTKEVFDLFYPSYGDTYPTYNGSIGMTYEQAGNSSGGASIIVGEDTLTLNDRVLHHYTTSLSTIEVTAQNSSKINKEFIGYFKSLKANGNGPFKSFILSGSNEGKLNELKKLLDKNNILYATANQGELMRGFHYFTGKEESYTASANDLVVSTCQSKGALVKVLFEPESKLSDSVTYDITAWSLPYAYGIDAFAVKEKINTQEAVTHVKQSDSENNAYGYILEYKSFQEGKILATLLNSGIKVRVAEKDFSSNGIQFKKGSLIVLRKGNEEKIDQFKFIINQQFHSTYYKISSGFMDTGADFGSDKVHLISNVKVALLSGENASSTAMGEVWHLFDQQLNYPITLINTESLSKAALDDFDVLIVADGHYKILSEKESTIKNWVKEGGKLIALENAVVDLSNGDWGIKLKKDTETNENKDASIADVKRYEDRERKSTTYNTPGSIYKVTLDDSHPLAFGYPDFYYTLKMNTNMLEYSKDGWNVGILKQENPVAGFVGNLAKSKIKDGAVISVQDYGAGKIVCFVDDLIFRSFWENGKLMFTNAVFMVK